MTSQCNLSCATCVKHYYESSWQNNDFSFENYQKLLSGLNKEITGIHLQGWGETLLDGDVQAFIMAAKARKLKVSFTTNGTIMSPYLAKGLIDSGLDGLTFSMAGNCAETQDVLRGKGTFSKLITSIEQFMEIKSKRASKTPRCAVSYLLTPSTVSELPGAVKRCRKMGIEQFSTVHLTQVVHPRQGNHQFHMDDRKNAGYNGLRRHTYINALFSKMKIELRDFHASPTPVCDKNPLNSTFINSQGYVSPCVFLLPPLGTKDLTWHHNQEQGTHPPLIMGNVTTSSLDDIWDSPQYKQFRQSFQKRLDIYEGAMAGVGFSMEGAEQLQRALEKIRKGFLRNPPPRSCRHCYKMDGF